MENTQNFTEGKILAPLLKFALPVLLALFLQAMYGAVDLLIVGKFGTAIDISAVSTGSQIMQTVTSLVTSLAMGITILAGQKIGEKDAEGAGDAIGSGICLFAVLGILMTAVMVGLSGPLAALMQAPEEAFDQTVVYIRICSGGYLFIVAYNVLGSIFRGIGDSRMPLITVAIACVLNIAGDLALIAGFHMGVAGAALATVMAQAVSVALSVLIIKGRQLPFTLSRQRLRFDGSLIKQIVRLGAPISLQDAGQRILSGDSGHRQLSGADRVRRGRHRGEALCLHHAGAVGLHAVHVGLCGAERGSKDLRAGKEGPGIRHLHVFRGGRRYGLAVLFPRRLDGVAVRQRQRPGRHLRGGGLFEGVCHRLPADLVPVLLSGIFQRMGRDRVRHGPGHHRRLLRPDTRVLFHEPDELGHPVSHRTGYAGVYGGADHAVSDLFPAAE